MSSSNSQLPPIYCISLEAATDRRARMRGRLGQQRLLEHTRFVDAIAASSVGHGSSSPTDLAGSACFASHLKAMRMLLVDERARDGAIVCEDDILLHNEFAERLGAVLENLPGDATFCSLGYMMDRSAVQAPLQWSGRDRDRRNVCRLLPRSVWATHCYWIAPSYAQAVLARYGAGTVDELPSMTEGIALESAGYVSHPPLALQEVIDSNVRPAEDLGFHFRGQQAWPYSEYSDCEQGQDRSPLVHDPADRRRSIALCMIVRDEAAVIERCVRSVMPLIDAWVICDTGSEDGTPELIERMLGELPGRLHHRRWRDFGHNRSELMALAAGSADYLLLLDADMTLDWRGSLPPLTADAYLLRHDGEPAYRVPRLVRGDRRWWFEGSTHEHLAGEGEWSQEVLESLVVQHYGDGGHRAEKLERDAALLERDLERAPDNARTVFYLAQTLRDLGEDERAIELYERRAGLGGWDQECFYAAYQAGSLLARRDDDRAVATLLGAWQLRPQRAEALHELARFCRFRGWREAGYLFAGRGAALPCPDDALFVHRWVYEWGMRFELALAAYWVADFQQALALCDELLQDRTLPAGLVESVRETRSYCIERTGAAPARRQPASLLKSCAPSFEVAEIRLDVMPAWPQFNPTIAADGDGFRMIVRTANYVLEDGRYRFLEDGDAVRTLNYLVTLDSRLAVTALAPLHDCSDRPARFPSRFDGYEDCRLVEVGERWFASATVRDRNPLQRCEIALLELDDADITAVTLLRSPIPAVHEKNWMPFSVDRELRFVYSCAPTVVISCNPETGLCSQLSSHPAPGGTQLRGGSQGVAVADGLLFLVHEADDGGRSRTYRHRFVLLDRDRKLTAGSKPFHLLSPDIEFCAGLAPRGGQLLLSFGVGDYTAMLGVVDADEALAMLEPIPSVNACLPT
jgi:predicted GH43/DUF377 family glycosyl hydrolase/tetratricopeptide (TPR) repeat protein